MSGRNARGPDKAMEQPKAYNSSIDAKRMQPSKIDTRQTQYKSAKPIDFKNKIPEYKPNNEYYKTSFWEAPRRKIVQQPQKKKEIPIPVPKKPPQKRPPPAPKPQNRNTMKPLPQANFNSKRPSVAPQQPQSPQYPVHQEPEPEAWSASPQTTEMEHWGEPNKVIPDLNSEPAPVAKEPDFSGMPSTVGSMSRMIAMFT